MYILRNLPPAALFVIDLVVQVVKALGIGAGLRLELVPDITERSSTVIN